LSERGTLSSNEEAIAAWESSDRNSAEPEARAGRASGRERVRGRGEE